MKKILSIICLSACISVYSQSTLYNVYDSQGNQGYKLIPALGTTKLFSKSIAGPGTNIIKMNLDGVPLTSKSYTYGMGDAVFHNGAIYALASYSASNYLLKIDTSNLNITQAIHINYSSYVYPSRLKIVGNTAWIVGSIQTSTTTGVRALIINYDISTNTLNYANAYALPTSSVGLGFYNITQLQNSSFALGGYHNSTGNGLKNFILRATANSSNFTIQQAVASTPQEIPDGNVNMAYASNNKLFCSSLGYIVRVDTNLTQIATPGTYSTYIIGGGGRLFNNKLYTSPTATDLVIYDNNMNLLSQVKYPYIPTFTAVIPYKIEDISVYPNSIYHPSYGYCSWACSTYVITKTDVNGALNCSQPTTSSFNAIPINSATPVSFTPVVVSITMPTVTPIAANTTVTPNYTVNCLTANGIREQNKLAALNIYKNSFGSYTIHSSSYFSGILVYDMNGKLIHEVDMENETNTTEFGLDHLSQGIYVVKVRYSDGGEAQQKLIHLK